MFDLDGARLGQRAAYLRWEGLELDYAGLGLRQALVPASDVPQLDFVPQIDLAMELCREAASAPRRQRAELDHCPVDAESLQRRIRNMLSTGDIIGSLLCMGDNDHVSVVIAAAFGLDRIVVVDREQAVLDAISDLNVRLGGTAIELVRLDVRDDAGRREFLQRNERRFSLATSDPPYTSAGYVGFLRVILPALRLGGALHLVAPYMLLEPWSVDLLRDIQLYAVMNGLVVTDAWRGAQTFQVGAGLVSSQFRFERNSLVSEEYSVVVGDFYTLERLWK
jgi:predicted methyltransferase